MIRHPVFVSGLTIQPEQAAAFPAKNGCARSGHTRSGSRHMRGRIATHWGWKAMSPSPVATQTLPLASMQTSKTVLDGSAEFEAL